MSGFPADGFIARRGGIAMRSRRSRLFLIEQAAWCDSRTGWSPASCASGLRLGLQWHGLFRRHLTVRCVWLGLSGLDRLQLRACRS